MLLTPFSPSQHGQQSGIMGGVIQSTSGKTHKFLNRSLSAHARVTIALFQATAVQARRSMHAPKEAHYVPQIQAQEILEV